jgi:outer membrane immunogenic protein
MMRQLILTIAILMVFGLSYGQNPLPKGQSQLNLGVGFSGWGVPVYIGLDYGVHNDVTIGGEISFRSYNERWASNHYKHSIIGISGNFNYHFNRILNIPPVWDFYAGLNLGFYMWSSPNDYYGKHNSGLGLGAQIGGRYYFSKNIGLNLEFGGGNAFSGGKFGVTIKL